MTSSATAAALGVHSVWPKPAYEVDAMTPDEFADFGAGHNTLRQFLDADAQLDALARVVLVSAP